MSPITLIAISAFAIAAMLAALLFNRRVRTIRLHRADVARKRAEQSSREQQEQLRLIVDTALDAVITMDSAGMISGWNPQAHSIFGWARDEALGRALKDLIVPQRYREAHERGLQRYLNSGQSTLLGKRIELAALHRDGHEFPIELAITPMRLGDSISFSAFVRDITARKKGEQALRESQQLLRGVVDNSPAIIYMKDLEGRYLLVNRRFTDLFGTTTEAAIGKTDYDVFPDRRDADSYRAMDQRVVAAGCALTEEEIAPLEDGMHVYLSVKTPLYDAQGKVYAVLGVSTDITERQRAEEALRHSEERFRALVTASSDVVYQMNPDWTELRHLRGRDFIPDTEAPSDSWLERYIHPKDHDLLLAAIREAIDNRSMFALEHQVLRVDGSLGWTFSRAVPLLDKQGNITEWFGAASDITERKETEQKLRLQLAQLDLLSRTTRAIGERQDLRSIFQVVVRSLEDYLPIDFGCICLYDPAQEFLTVTCVGSKSQALALELAMPDQAHISIDQNGLSQCLRGKLVYEPDVSDSNFPFPQRLASGGLRALVIAPLLVESSVFGVLIAARRQPKSFSSSDCEFLRQLSEHMALASHQAQLHSALQNAYDELRQTQQAVMQQERLRALGQMASGIAHDINNALSPVALYAEALRERETHLSERGRRYLETISQAVDDVAATVARLREFYRQREPQLKLQPLQLQRIVPQVVDLTQARWSDIPMQRGVVIDMKTELARDLPAVMGIESEIREALTNLIFNAVDAMPDGGVLSLRALPEPDDGRPPGSVLIEISDTGVGMDEETRLRCLEPFFTTKGERGTGLGLAMVYGVIQRHGADITIDSTPGQGTTVRLSFPVATQSASTESPPARLVPARLHILVVDDDPVLLKSLCDTLEMDGHRVVSANGGQAGINAFRAAHERGDPFAVVITDMGMPYVDGRKVAATVKSLSPAMPVLMLTGWGQRLISEGTVPPEVDRVLSKPPKLHDLREALSQLSRPSGS